MRSTIEQTKAFKKLSNVEKNIYNKAANMNEITRLIHIAKTINKKDFIQVHKPSRVALAIISELVYVSE